MKKIDWGILEKLAILVVIISGIIASIYYLWGGLKMVWSFFTIQINSFWLIIAIWFFIPVLMGINRWNRKKKEEELRTLKSKYEEEIKQLESKKKEEVSKKHFDTFEEITQSFETLFNTNKNPLVKIFNELYAKTPELLSYNNGLKDYISRSYNNYIKRLKKFDGTKECFELLVNEFENVYFAYEDLFVKPIEKRKDKIARDKNLKRGFNKFAAEYEHRRLLYKDYGEKMNRLFDSNIIRTDFDFVGTL